MVRGTSHYFVLILGAWLFYPAAGLDSARVLRSGTVASGKKREAALWPSPFRDSKPCICDVTVGGRIRRHSKKHCTCEEQEEDDEEEDDPAEDVEQQLVDKEYKGEGAWESEEGEPDYNPPMDLVDSPPGDPADSDAEYTNPDDVIWVPLTPPAKRSGRVRSKMWPNRQDSLPDITNQTWAIPKPTPDPPTTGIPQPVPRYGGLYPPRLPFYWGNNPMQGNRPPYERQMPFNDPSSVPMISQPMGGSFPTAKGFVDDSVHVKDEAVEAARVAEVTAERAAKIARDFPGLETESLAVDARTAAGKTRLVASRLMASSP